MSFFVGLPVNTHDFLSRGVEPMLDYLQETARVNAVIINAHDFYGTCNYTSHEKYFAGTKLRDIRPEEIKDFDVLEAVTGPARKRGMQVYSHVLAYENVLPPTAMGGKKVADENGYELLPNSVLVNLSQVLEIDVFGRKGYKPCVNNPDYRQYYMSLIEDQLRSYPIEGINFNTERYGPMENTLMGNFPSGLMKRKPTAPTCFCPHCVSKAKDLGINVERAKTGFLALLEFSERSWLAALKSKDPLALEGTPLCENRDTTSPPDGYFNEFFRILMRYPEILAWNQMWNDSLHSWFKELYGTVKAVSPDRKIGWHVWHQRAYSPFERVGYNVRDMRRYSDWIKPKMDHNCFGYRYHLQIRKLAQALFYDRTLEKAYSAINTIMGWEEIPLEDLLKKGVDMDYIRKDTLRYVQSVYDEVPIYPGIGLDMPSGPLGHPGYHPTEPEGVKAALRTTAEAGAKGVVLSRSFGEMRHINLVAAGEAIDEINKNIKG